MISAKILTLLFGATLTAASLAATELVVHGSSTVYNSFLKEAQPAIEKNSGIRLVVSPNGSGSGLADLAKGKADMAMISSELPSVAAKVNQSNAGLIELSEYRAFLLDEVEAVFVIHASNPVKSLTSQQLAALLSGEIGNWKALGGPDLPVIVITMIPGDGVRTAVEHSFLRPLGKSFSTSARQLPSANQAANVVAQIPHSIGIAGIATVHPGIQVVATDATVLQRLYLVTKSEPTSEQKRVIEAAQNL